MHNDNKKKRRLGRWGPASCGEPLNSEEGVKKSMLFERSELHRFQPTGR